jgi:hypothetical protein
MGKGSVMRSSFLSFSALWAVVALLMAGVVWASPAPGPSGERILGGQGINDGVTPAVGPTQGKVLEPVYDDMTGEMRYVSTPVGAPDPVNSPPHATAPFYLPVYPVGSTVPDNFTLVCLNLPMDNCPDHGAAVAGAAEAIMGHILGAASPYANGVIGHDHLMAGPGSGGDFNVAWVPTLVLFTNMKAADRHITLLSQIQAMQASGDVILVPLDGTDGTPNRTFHCSVVSEAPYDNALPWVTSGP